jgi:transposase
MEEFTSVGLDVHARKLRGCAVVAGTGEIVERELMPELGDVLEFLGGLPGGGLVRVVYETGPTGFWLCRGLRDAGIDCRVVATSKLPRVPGEKVKTDRRDARKLAQFQILGEGLVAVEVPTVSREGARDVARAHDDARRDLMKARQQATSQVLRYGFVFPGATKWTKAHMEWLRTLKLPDRYSRVVLDWRIEVIMQATRRKKELVQVIEQMVRDGEFTQMARRLMTMRGISVVAAFTLCVELGDLNRFTARGLAAFLGLVPGERSSGERTRRGKITRTGNALARRVLIEAAQTHAKPYRPTSPSLQARWALAPDAVVARARVGNKRLADRWVHHVNAGMSHNKIVTAIAREMTGWLVEVATMAP